MLLTGCARKGYLAINLVSKCALMEANNRSRVELTAIAGIHSSARTTSDVGSSRLHEVQILKRSVPDGTILGAR